MRTRWTFMILAAFILLIACSGEQAAEKTTDKAPAEKVIEKAKSTSPALGTHSDTTALEEKMKETEGEMKEVMEETAEDADETVKDMEKEAKEVVKKIPEKPVGN